MFSGLPEVAREIRAELIDLYWLILPVAFLIAIVLEFFKVPDGNPSGGKLIKRVVVSMIMLWTFDDVLLTLADFTDGIADRIGGMAGLMDTVSKMADRYKEQELDWLAFREWLIFVINLTCYIIAYFGVFISQALIHFTWTILYIASPLMILAYVSERTAFVTTNLYKGIFSVAIWKILYAILGVLLLKLATSPQYGDWDNFLLTAIINIFIGVSLLLVPFTAKSLISDGMSSAATATGAATAGLLGRTLYRKAIDSGKLLGKKAVGSSVQGAKTSLRFGFDEARRAFPKTREFVKETPRRIKAFGENSVSSVQNEGKAIAKSYAELVPRSKSPSKPTSQPKK